ncbi:MAG: hypothetical protein LBR08_06490 [Bacteroidales bacterium]|jgi:hypothetical protein|nr:hypothetical protein [Bacteroidales bacterium]
MKNFIRYSLVFGLLWVTAVAYGKKNPPASVTIDASEHYRHGYNQSHTTSPESPREDRDSVTVTSTMKYFVLPDSAVSPAWYNSSTGAINDVTNISNLKSKFSWSLSVAPLGELQGSSGITSQPDRVSPILPVTWTTIGVDTLKMREVSNANVACGGTETKVPVAVIRKPAITFTQVNNRFRDSICLPPATVAAGYDYSFPIKAFTGAGNSVKISYTITPDPSTAANVPPNGTNVSVPAGASGVSGVITLQFKDYGEYTVTITAVSDRISVKSAVPGDLGTGTGETNQSETFVFTIIRPVQTGPIYRIPNNY